MMGGVSDMGKIPELKKRIFFTLSMLAVYRLGVFVPTPGIDVEALRLKLDAGAKTLFGLVNMFSGGALENFSIFTLGITPYISMSIMMQLLATMVPSLEALKKEGEQGQRKITRMTRQGTVVLALFQSYLIGKGLLGQGLVINAGPGFIITTMITLTTGTAFIMWLGEQITERGIGNGMSVLIAGGICARMPSAFISTLSLARDNQIQPLGVIALFLFLVGSIAFIVFVERSYRKIPIQYPRRMVGKKMTQASTQPLPLKLNMAGVIPPIFASSFLVVPATIASFSTNEDLQNIVANLHPGTWIYTGLFVSLIIAFSYFYTAIIFNPVEIAENLKKNGGFIPTVRPGKETSDYLYAVINRLTIWGALYIAAVCVVPQLVYIELNAVNFSYIFGGTAVLIVVGVTLDTFSQIESHVVARNYETFMSRSAKTGRGGMASMVGGGKGKLLRR